MSDNGLHTQIICPCCNEYRMEDYFDICPVCGWEHDPVQYLDWNYAGGANKESLNEYRQKFIQLREEGLR